MPLLAYLYEYFRRGSTCSPRPYSIMSRRRYDDDDEPDHVEYDPHVKRTLRGPVGVAKRAKPTPKLPTSAVPSQNMPAYPVLGPPQPPFTVPPTTSTMPGSFTTPTVAIGDDPYDDYNASKDAQARRAKVCNPPGPL